LVKWFTRSERKGGTELRVKVLVSVILRVWNYGVE
jgi:hypothetical protein